MSAEYTPTTEIVREDYVRFQAEESETPRDEATAEFNRWLADVADGAGAVAAQVLEQAADDMAGVIALGDAAESTAVPAGTKGVGSAIGARDALYEDPVAWLRDRAARLRGATR